jgi:phosphatidylglycerophosphate synthase
MVSTSLILLTGRFGKIVALPTAVILAREISVSALREWMAQRNMRDSVKVGFQGKLKTAATMVSLTLLLLAKSVSSTLFQTSVAMLYLCALLTVTSGSVYFRAAAPVLMESK